MINDLLWNQFYKKNSIFIISITLLCDESINLCIIIFIL
jgi:hypothetical protein